MKTTGLSYGRTKRRAWLLAAPPVLLAALASCQAMDPAEGPIGTLTNALTQTVTYQRDTLGTVADTFLSTHQPKKNFGTQPMLRVSARNEALLRFDLSSIPSYAVIDSATLKVYLNGDEDDDECADGDREGFPVVPIKLHRVTAAWDEGTVTYANFAQKFDATVAGILVATSRESYKAVDVKSLVQAWTGGAQQNYGLILTTSRRAHTVIVSSEGPTVVLRPSLQITYTVPDNHCSPNPCQNGGSCINGATSYTCQCAAGYTGTNCQTLIDKCAANPCLNNGTCANGVGTYTCTCVAGYSGNNCQTLIDNCAVNPCQNGGTCTNGVNSYTCTCAPGYTGTRCEILINNCAMNPCMNGGTCANGVNTYTCTCALGFTGTNCEINVDDCVGNACQNGAICIDGIASYTCSCAPGYTGQYCQTLIDKCAVNPCKNGGTCANGVNAYTCTCAPGYTGTTCEIDINECATNPCQNGGTCVDGVNSYTCVCPPTYAGTNCQTPICVPATCATLGDKCGAPADGCGGLLSCGTCTAPQTCGGGGTPNVCGCSTTVQVAAGQSHSLALLRDGTVRAWGSNASGQLGNGTSTNSSLPVALPACL